MKKYINVIAKVIICILVALNLTSCWSARELNKLAIVMGVGIDKVQEIDEVKITVQVAKTLEMKGSSQNGNTSGGNKAYFNLQENAKSVSDGVKVFNRELNRKLLFSHNQVIILGKDIAESGIEKYIDFFLRYRENRLLVWILVSNETASEILDVNPELEAIPGRNIGELIRNEQKASQIPAVNLKEFASKLMSKTTAPIVPIIQISKENNKKVAYLSQTAVFKKDKMVGTLNKTETRGLLWGIDKVKRGVIVLKTENTEGKVNIEITGSTAKIIPQIKDDKVSIKINIKEEGDLTEQTSSEDLANPKAFGVLQKAEEDAIKSEVMAALKKARELNADIFGFGDSIYKHYPKQWIEMENNWDEIFQNIHVDVNVDAKLRRTGRITKPIMFKE